MSPNPDRIATTDFPIPEFYTNAVNVSASLFEVEMQCLLMDSTAQTRGAFHVRLSPQAAKALQKALGRTLEEYEKQHGKIPGPA